MVKTAPRSPIRSADDHESGSARRRTVSGSGGLTLAVFEWGPVDAPTVVLVHGYPDTHAMWEPVAELLAADHHVVAYDVRGAGESAAPDGTAGYAMGHLNADLLAVMDATSPDRPAHVVGHDWGSIQTWAAVCDPAIAARIASFTSMSGPPIPYAAAWVQDRLRHPGGGRWRPLGRQLLRSWYVALFHTPLAPYGWRHGVARQWPKALVRREGVTIDERWPAPTLAEDAARGVCLYRANVGAHGTRPGAMHTDVPVQLVVARHDSYVTPAWLSDIETIAPDLVRSEVDGRHWYPRAEPERFARLVREHVERVDGRPARARTSA